MTWNIWVIGGLAILGLEMFTPSGFVLFFVGLSCILSGVIMFLTGNMLPNWAPWVICTLSIIVMLIKRKNILALMGVNRECNDSPLNEEITVRENIAPGATGQGEMRGSSWKVRNVGTSELIPGGRYRVIRIDGLTVETQSEN